jgi:RimJ/RimL family protein N-acetyltransferase
MTTTFTIRRAGPSDIHLLRELRIAALTDSPKAFSSTLDREHARTEANWLSWVTPPSVTFILESAEGETRGIVAGAPEKDDPSIVILMSMWVHESHRGTGAARQLIGSVQKWAADLNAREVQLLVNESNPVARGCYERTGFRATGKRGINPVTGEPEIEMSYSVPA